MSIKPIYGIGASGPLTDSNFEPIKGTRRKAQTLANSAARKTLKSGLSDYAKGHVFDAGSYYRISVCVTAPRVTG